MRSRKTLPWSLSLILPFLLCSLFLPYGAEAEQPSKITLTGKVDMLASYCAGSGVKLESRQLPTVVLSVRKGSPAFYAGVAKGDRVLNGSIEGNRFHLWIKRGEKAYLVKLRAKKGEENQNLKAGTKRIKLSARELSRRFHTIIIADRSGSMVHPLGNSNVSRWSWIAKQIKDYALNLERSGGSGFDLALFNEDVLFKSDISGARVEKLIDSTITTGNTNLVPVLTKVTRHYLGLKTESPPLILIFTDGLGMDAQKDSVKKVLLDTRKKLGESKPLKVLFFQAGFSEAGTKFISDLNSRSKSPGMVKAVLFEKISRDGLFKSLPGLTE